MMGGYSEKCPACEKWFIKPGIVDHIKAKHPEALQAYREQRFGIKASRVMSRSPTTGPVVTTGDFK